MRTEIKLLMDKQGAGGALHTEEIRALMIYALELLKEFEQLTLESIDRANKKLAFSHFRTS